jgi:hypothetical protein
VIIPLGRINKGKDRDEQVQTILDICLASKRDRDQLYQKRKRYFMFGTSDYSVEVKYNRLQAHTDLVSSFLYAPDHCRYNISAPRNSSDEIVAQFTGLEDEWNEVFRDSGLAYMYAEGVLWSLIYDSMFIKLGWNTARSDLIGKLFSPSDFAVYDESEPDLDSQEAFVHSYSLNWDNAVQRLLRAGKKAYIKQLARRPGNYTDDMPAVLANLIINSTGGPNLMGAMTGRANMDYEPRAVYEPNSDNPMVRFHELWVWDDISEDYAIFTMADGVDGVLSDSRETVAALAKASDPLARARFEGKSNIFIEDEHPFIHIKPYGLYNFFWGEAHVDRLIPLQIWTNERLAQIADILERQVDPAKVFSGFMGLTDEKADALGGPNTWVYDMVPGAKVDELKPPMPEDLFVEFNQIGQIFLEASGLTETVTGQGTQGVRAKGHAKQLAMTGSGRIKKVAVGLEQSLSKLGDVGIKLLQKNSSERFKTDAGQEMVPALMAMDRLKIRVAGHSHSPLFADESKEQAAALFKAQAIDREMLIRMLNPPNADNMIHALRKRVKAEQEAQKAKLAAGIKEKEGHKSAA